MKPIPADRIIEGLSEDLQDLVVREAFVRRRQEALQAELKEKHRREAALQEKKPGLFGGKGAKEEHEAAMARLRTEIAACAQAIANGDLILNKTGRIIETEIEHYFQGQLPALRNAAAAQKLVPDWEHAVGLYQSCLKQFIMKLGIARNQMSSGYDRKAGTFAVGAQEAFNNAVNAARALESEAAIPNQIAKRQRDLLGVETAPAAGDNSAALPYVGSNGVAKQVAALKTITLEAAQTRISALIDECEKKHQEELPRLLEGVGREREGQDSDQKKHLQRALTEIRTLADGSVDAAQMDAVCASMEGRFVTLTGG